MGARVHAQVFDLILKYSSMRPKVGYGYNDAPKTSLDYIFYYTIECHVISCRKST